MLTFLSTNKLIVISQLNKMNKNRPQTPGRAPEPKLPANASILEVSRIPATQVHVPLLATKFDVAKSPSIPLIESFPYEDSSAGSSLNIKTVSSPPPSASSRNPLRLLFQGTSKMPNCAPYTTNKRGPQNLKIITALMLPTAVIAQPYYLGEPNGAFYLPSASNPAAIPATCIEWAYPNDSTCYCANTTLTNPTMMIDPSLIGPSFYLKTFAGQWGSLVDPGPFQTQLSMTFGDLFNSATQVSGSAGIPSFNQQTLSLGPHQLVNKISIYNDFLSTVPSQQSHKRWDIYGRQIVYEGPKSLGEIGSQTAQCAYSPKGPIVGVKTYLSSANFFCGVALAYNTCSCTSQLFLLDDYALITLNWVTGMSSVVLDWSISSSLRSDYMTNFLPHNCGDYLLSPVTTSINGYTPVSIVTDGFLVSTPGSPNSVTLNNPSVSGVYKTLLQVTNPSGYNITGDPTQYYATPLYFYVKVVVTVHNCVIGIKSGYIKQMIEAPADPSVSTYIIVSHPNTCGASPQYAVHATQTQPTAGVLQTNPPFWVLDLFNNRVILQSNDPTLHDTKWRLDLVVTINSVATTQSLVVIWYHCNFFVLNSKSLWNIPEWRPSPLVASILGPAVSSTYTEFEPIIGPCGLITYSISPALPSYMTYDQVSKKITVLAPLAAPVGTTTFTLKATSNDWPAMTVEVPLIVTITGCLVTVITTTPLISGAITKKIFESETPYPISTYVQTPACGYSPQYAMQASQLFPTVGTLQTNPPFMVLDAANGQVKLKSNDPTLHGTTWKLGLLVTIGLMTDTQTFEVSWVDPCLGTAFAAQTIADSFGFISNPAISVSLPVPWLNDQVNIANVGSTTSSICSTQSFVVTENGLSPSYLSTSFDSGQNFMKFSTTNTLMAGPHVIKVDYKLDLYPTVTSTASFNFVFYNLIVPIPPATTTYQVASAALNIPIGEYQTNPVNSAMVITKTATLAGGGVLPGFIVFSEIGSGSTAQRKFTVSTLNNSDVGTYQILVTTTFSLVGQTITQTQTFTLKVNSLTVYTNLAPKITSGYEPEFRMYWNSTKVIDLELDDLEKDAVKVIVDFASLSYYCNHTSSNTKIQIRCGPLEIQPAKTINDTITITLRDDRTPVAGTSLPQNQYFILFHILFQMDPVYFFVSNTTASDPTSVAYTMIQNQDKKKENQVIALPLLKPQIAFISNMAVVNVTFNGNISANITKEQIKVRYIQNSQEINQMATFKWNITQVNTTFTFMLIQINFTHPILISQGRLPDMIEVHLRNDYLYPLNKTAPFLDLNFTQVTQIMPKLAPSKEAAETIDQLSSLTAEIATSSFWTFLALYVVLSTAMKYVWATFNTLQIILILPMLVVNVPVNVTNVQDSFKKIVNLEFIDKHKVYKVICEPLFGEIIETVKGPEPGTTEISSDFLAEKSKSLVIQITLLVVFCVILAAAMVGLLVIRIFAQKIKNQTVLNAYKSLEAKVMFSSILRYAIQQYMALSITTLVALNKIVGQSEVQGRLLEAADAAQPDIKQIVITSFLTVFLIFYPAFCFWFLNRYAIILYMQVMKMRFGTLYVGLNYYKKSSHAYLTIFLVRRLFFAIIVVNVTQNVSLQLMLCLYCSMMMLLYLMVYMPMWDLALNIIFLFNEACLFVCTAMQFLFTDYVPSPDDRFKLGWVYLGVLGFNVLGNVGYTGFDIVTQVKKYFYFKKIKQELLAFRERRKVFLQQMAAARKKDEQEARDFQLAIEMQEMQKQVEGEEGERQKIVDAQLQVLKQKQEKERERERRKNAEIEIQEDHSQRKREELALIKIKRRFEINMGKPNAYDDDEWGVPAKQNQISVEEEVKQRRILEKVQEDLEEYKNYLLSYNKNNIALNDSRLLQSMVEQEWDGLYVSGAKVVKKEGNKVQDARHEISDSTTQQMTYNLAPTKMFQKKLIVQASTGKLQDLTDQKNRRQRD